MEEKENQEEMPKKKKLVKIEKGKLEKLLKEKAEELKQIEAEAKVKPKHPEEIGGAVSPVLKQKETSIRKLEEELEEIPATKKEEEKRKYWDKSSGYEKRSAGTISDYVSGEENENK